MKEKENFLKQVLGDYYKTLQDTHERLGEDKDAALYERIIILGHFSKRKNDSEFIRQIESWVLERRSLIEYFCNDNRIGKCLESIITSYNAENIGIASFIFDVAKERLMQVKNGMSDQQIEG